MSYPNPLSRTEERRLIRLAQDGDVKAKHRLVESNTGLVMSRARLLFSRYQPIYIELDDLFGFGIIGLSRAIEKFDLSTSSKLSTYATWWIDRAIHRAVHSAHVIKRPLWHFDDVVKIKRVVARGINNILAISEATELTEDRVRQVLKIEKMCNCGSTDVIVKRGESTFCASDFIADKSDPYAVVDNEDVIEQLFDKAATSDYHQSILWAIDGDQMEYTEVGVAYGKSYESIRQARKSTIDILRRHARLESEP